MKLSVKNWSLTVKLNALIAVIAIIVFTALSFLISSSANTQIKDEKKFTLARDGLYYANLTDKIINDLKEQAEDDAKNPFVVKELDEKKINVLHVLVRDRVHSLVHINSFYITNTDGIIVAGLDKSNNKLRGNDVKENEFWKRLKNSNVAIENFAHKSKTTGRANFSIASKVFNKNGEFIGTVVLVVDIYTFYERFLTKKIGKHGYMVLFDSKGTFLTHPQQKLVLKNFANMNWMKNLLNSKEKTGAMDYTFQGIEKFLTFSKLKLVPWYIITLVEIHDILAVSNSITRIILISGIASTILLVLASFIVLRMMIAKPLGKMVEKFTLGAQGDFEVNMRQRSNDEIGVLAKSFNTFMDALRYKAGKIEEIADGNLNLNLELASDRDKLGISLSKMVDNLNEILSEVNTASEQVTSGAEQISAASQSLSQGASEQASSVEEISATSTEINNQAKLNSENLGVAKNLSQETYKQTNEVNEKMDFLLNAVDEINKSSEEIKKITKVIDDIAFQINLLALNANVEAARAGKYGKGFAVVAEEVRNLAMKSAASVKETSSKVDSAIENIGLVSTNVETLYSTLKKVNESSSKVNELMMEVEAATSEQAKAIEQIDNGLSQIETVTESNSANAEETAATSEELSAQAKQLNSLIDRFKLRQKKAYPFLKIC